MIAYVLDTNAAVALLTGRSPTLANRILGQPPGAIALPTLVVHELYYGAFRSQRIGKNIEALRLLTSNLPKLDFDVEDARSAGHIRAVLAHMGKPIGPCDVLIAGQAKARGLTVITNNVREFSRVNGLKVEDWTL